MGGTMVDMMILVLILDMVVGYFPMVRVIITLRTGRKWRIVEMWGVGRRMRLMLCYDMLVL